ncbi:MAG: hypothetical protein JSV64_04195 [Candidatus Bathyarchaeota archaeon]|nr:MAG: hypothetical protein JSV64_04195 [Candidatus Bathyarchaeota archaeon]
MREKGLTDAMVLQKLESGLQEDFTYGSGQILGSIDTKHHKFAEGIENMKKISLLTKPTMNIVGITSNGIDIDIHELAWRLRKQNGVVSMFPNHIRIPVMPHFKRVHVQNFLEDLKTIVKEIR